MEKTATGAWPSLQLQGGRAALIGGVLYVVYLGWPLVSATRQHDLRTDWKLTASGLLGVAFVAFHSWHMGWQRVAGRGSEGTLFTVLCADFSGTWWGVPWVAMIYLVGSGVVAWALTRRVVSPTAGPFSKPIPLTFTSLLALALSLAIFVLSAHATVVLATGSRW